MDLPALVVRRIFIAGKFLHLKKESTRRRAPLVSFTGQLGTRKVGLGGKAGVFPRSELVRTCEAAI